MANIEKKLLPGYYADVRRRVKTFEIRKDEDNIQPGDILTLREWDGHAYTGHKLTREVTYVLRDCSQYGLQEGYCIIGIMPIGWNEPTYATQELPKLPRVLSYAELEDTMGERPVWLEEFMTESPCLAVVDENLSFDNAYMIFDYDSGKRNKYTKKTYGKTWRCWSAPPTEPQREATPWA